MLSSENPSTPPLLKGGVNSSPFEKGGTRGIFIPHCPLKYLICFSLLLVLSFAAPASVVAAQEPVCIQCHDSDMMKPGLRKIPGEWRQSWHYQNGVACHDCHGGDPVDAALAMSPERGFVGKPGHKDVPEFCGKCHIGILKNYLESGHGKALKSSGSGPNCVTCHGSHAVQKASIDIINEQRCTQCHSFDRAGKIKQALSSTEKRIHDIDKDLANLSGQGIYTEEETKALFRTHAEFRTLFHTVDVSLVKQKTDGFLSQLDMLQKKVDQLFRELKSRKYFSGFFFLLFAAMGIVTYLLGKTYMR